MKTASQEAGFVTSDLRRVKIAAGRALPMEPKKYNAPEERHG